MDKMSVRSIQIIRFRWIWLIILATVISCENFEKIETPSVVRMARDGKSGALEELEKRALEGQPDVERWLGNLYDEGSTALPKDYRKALSWYEVAARDSDASAMSRISDYYEEGKGVGKDLVESAKWELRSAENGNWSSQLGMGLRYQYANGVPQNYVEANKWYACSLETLEKEVALSGSATFTSILATHCIIFPGINVSPNYKRAAELFQLLIDKYEDANSMCWLGELYRDGNGVRRDMITAHMWFNLAASRGEARAREKLEEIERGWLSPEAISRAQELASKWKPMK